MQHKIIQLFAKEILFKRCSECKGRIIPIQIDETATGLYYCEQCSKEITTFEHNYTIKLELLDIHTEEVLVVKIYDKVAENFLGCSPNEIYKRYSENKDYWKLLESIARGQFIETVSDRKNKFKLTSVKLRLPNDPTLIGILDKITTKGLHYHNSLKI